jgi:hypothetical protein
MDQFIDLCILSGCDYCENIRGIFIRLNSAYDLVVTNLGFLDDNLSISGDDYI